MKYQSDIPITCIKCGHTGNIHLNDSESLRLRNNLVEQWLSRVGWKVMLISFTVSAVLGVLFGRWKP